MSHIHYESRQEAFKQLDNGGRPVNYICNIKGEDYELALDMPDRHGSFVGKLTNNDTSLSGR